MSIRVCQCCHCIRKDRGVCCCILKTYQRVCVWKNYKLWRNILVVYVTTFTIILPILCSNMQNTMLDKLYFRNTTAENQRLIRNNNLRYNISVDILNAIREKESSARLRKLLAGSGESIIQTEDLLSAGNASFMTSSDVMKDAFPADNTLAHTTGQKIDIIITIITMSRNSTKGIKYNPNYLVQTLAAFVEMFDSDSNVFDKFSLGLRVCNVDPNPEKYSDMILVPKWIPIYQRFSKPSSPIEKMSYSAILNKEKNDYVYCLDKSLRENTSFVLLVEDDAVPRRELFSVLDTKLFRADDARSDKGNYAITENVTFIKLYHPERLLGYIAIERERLTELFSLALILAVIFMCSYFKCAFTNTDTSRWVWFVVFIFFCAVLLTIGRPNMLELRRISNDLYQVVPAPSCCTPAMLFPRKGAQLVSNHLKTVKCKAKFGKDSALDQFIADNKLITKLISPNLFEHIGHFSSLRSELLNPFIV